MKLEDFERKRAHPHEQDVEPEAHPERVDRPATRDQERHAGRERSQPGEPEQPRRMPLGDEVSKRATVRRIQISNGHAGEAAHAQVKAPTARN
jgi:hypothetical protein